MGADAKRKEARKRKFGIVATASLCNTAPTSENNAAVVYEPRKKRKESQEPSTKADARSPIAENEQAENATTLSNAASQGQDTAIEKTQRFIVFIGL